MKKLVILSIMVVTLLACSQLAFAADSLDNKIIVQGVAEKILAPDIAYVTLGLKTQSPQVEVSRNQNAAVMSNIELALASLGVEKNKIQTTNFNLRTVYLNNTRGGLQEVDGYELTNDVIIEIDDLSKIGTIVDSALKAGANDVSNVRFALKSDAQTKNDLLALAVKNGKKQAEIIANASGRTLGTLSSATVISAQSYNMDNYRYRANMSVAAKETSKIFTGSLKMTAELQLTYNLL